MVASPQRIKISENSTLFKRSIDEVPRTKCILFIILCSLQKINPVRFIIKLFYIRGV